MTKPESIGLVILITLMIVCLIPRAEAGEIDLTKAVIHHTASPDVSAKTIDGWHKARGWDGIGYHFVIRENGRIEGGRSLKKKGAHARTGKPYSRNHYVGIVLTGRDGWFTKKQTSSLLKLLSKLGIKHIERHHEECPGNGNINYIMANYPNMHND